MAAELLRTFIAVKIPSTPQLRRLLDELAAMGRAVKPVSPDGMHITLKFLGETPAEQVPAIGEIVTAAAAPHALCELKLVGLGAFPHPGRPSVVWCGVEGGQPLIEIANRLEKHLRPLGFKRERRPFTPHLTLARVRARPPEELKERLVSHAATDFGRAHISSVELYQSELTPSGARYTVLHAAPFTAAAP